MDAYYIDGLMISLSSLRIDRFHRDCVHRWVQLHRRCPLCKKKANVEDLIGRLVFMFVHILV